jgi:hypothetical protein
MLHNNYCLELDNLLNTIFVRCTILYRTIFSLIQINNAGLYENFMKHPSKIFL